MSDKNKINYVKRKVKEHIFYFKYDISDSTILHIYARHLTEPKDAIITFFSADPIWNEKRKRFETYSENHGLYWFWLNQNDKKVMIVSCFTLEK